MPKVTLRFYEELNEYLTPEKQKRDFEVRFEGDRTLGRILEEQGVPAGVVDLILVNGQSVHLDYFLEDGDRVSIYPVFERLDIGSVTNLRSRPLRNPRFVAENRLTDLAGRLRMLGFDVRCNSDLGTEEATEISRKEGRILLTTRKDIMASGKITHGLFIGRGGVEDQIRKIMKDLDLYSLRTRRVCPGYILQPGVRLLMLRSSARLIRWR
jgi:uncharacterized protein